MWYERYPRLERGSMHIRVHSPKGSHIHQLVQTNASSYLDHQQGIQIWSHLLLLEVKTGCLDQLGISPS